MRWYPTDGNLNTAQTQFYYHDQTSFVCFFFFLIIIKKKEREKYSFARILQVDGRKSAGSLVANAFSTDRCEMVVRSDRFTGRHTSRPTLISSNGGKIIPGMIVKRKKSRGRTVFFGHRVIYCKGRKSGNVESGESFMAEGERRRKRW